MFVLAYAAVRPLFMSAEPNAFPVLGNTIFYSLAEGMEATYFAGSFTACVAFVLILSIMGLVRVSRTPLPAPVPGDLVGPGRFLLSLGLLAPWMLLLLPHGPPVLIPDAMHHGEKLIFQGNPLGEAYRTYHPFKPLLYMKAAAMFGHANSVATYLAVHEVVQRLGYIVFGYLLMLIVRLVRGRYSLIPIVVLLLAYPVASVVLRHRYWILDMERLLFFLLFLCAILLSLILRRVWLLVFAGLFLSIQYLASMEYAIFATFALLAHLLLLALRDRREGVRAAVAVGAGALPIASALWLSGQLFPLLQFIAYTTKFPYLYGTPLLYSLDPPSPRAASHALLLLFIAAWIGLLWAASVFAPRAMLRRQLDDRSLWIYVSLILSILMFKIGLGRSDVQHLYLPLLFTALFLMTLILTRVGRLTAAPRPVPLAGLLVTVAVAAVPGSSVPGVPTGFSFEPAPRVRAWVPESLRGELAALRTIMAMARARSLFLFSDQPLYNYLLGLPYELRNPTVHEILTDDMLTIETERFRRWAPDLVVWKTDYWTNFLDGIRPQVRDYRLAGAILERYRPLAAWGAWLFMIRDDLWPPGADSLRARGFEPIDWAALEETFDWRDMPLHIGRSSHVPADFRTFTLTLRAASCCAYRQDGRALITFRGRPGTRRFALYPEMAPGFRPASWSPDSIVCGPCDESLAIAAR